MALLAKVYFGDEIRMFELNDRTVEEVSLKIHECFGITREDVDMFFVNEGRPFAIKQTEDLILGLRLVDDDGPVHITLVVKGEYRTMKGGKSVAFDCKKRGSQLHNAAEAKQNRLLEEQAMELERQEREQEEEERQRQRQETERRRLLEGQARELERQEREQEEEGQHQAGVTGKLDISSRMLVCRRMGGVGGWDYDDYDPDQAFEAYKGSMDEDMVTIGKKSEGDSRGDDEILEEMREKRMLQNDLWQFGTFGDLCEDDWHGYWTEYEASGGGGGGRNPGGKGEGQEAEEGGSSFRLAPAAGPPGLVVTSTARRDGKGRQIDQDCELAITYDDKDGLLGSFKDCLRSKLVPIDFRGVNGNLVNKNIYSFSQVGKGSITIELAIAENELADAQHRMRVILGYTEEEGTSRHRLARAFVCREARGGAAAAARAASGGAPPLYGEVGTGIYDIPRASSPEDYYTIYEEGLLTVRFPAVVRTEDFGAITLDWAPSDIRYQVDRTFKRFDGSAHTLGVIEISTENAKTYAPEFPKQ